MSCPPSAPVPALALARSLAPNARLVVGLALSRSLVVSACVVLAMCAMGMLFCWPRGLVLV